MKHNGIICPKCKKDKLTIVGNLIFSAPSEYYHAITKDAIAKKDFEILGVDWGGADYICPTCGNIKLKADCNRCIHKEVCFSFWESDVVTSDAEDNIDAMNESWSTHCEYYKKDNI